MGRAANMPHSATQRHTHAPAPSSATASTTAANTHQSLTPYSATRSTFHHSATPSTLQGAVRNPLAPFYHLPAYPICTPPPPPFVRSSLDISDIDRSCPPRPRMQQRSRDPIGVHDTEGARPRGDERNRVARRQVEKTAPMGLHSYLLPAAVDAADDEQPDETSEPFTAHFATFPPTPLDAPSAVSPPSRPRSSPPSTTAASHSSVHRSPYARFSHSPHVLTLPAVPFDALYHTAVPSTDPLPPFRCTLKRTAVLPSKCAPMGGVAEVDGAELDEEARSKRRRSKRGNSRRLNGVSARVQCWRDGEGEVERGGVPGGGSHWQQLRVQDIELVSSLTF